MQAGQGWRNHRRSGDLFLATFSQFGTLLRCGLLQEES